ncbi:hypothetical protein JCM10450v2_008024 [Rhodotorula kratochvilovae]
MGRSAKLTKRFSKQDREARKINAQSGPDHRDRSASPDSAGPSAIPLFNTSVAGRMPTKPDPRHAAHAQSGDMLDDADAEDGIEPALEHRGEDEEPAAQRKKKAGLKDKVRAAKKQLKDDEDRSNDKLSGAQKRKGKKPGVLGSVDYVKLHEARPGKKKFR